MSEPVNVPILSNTHCVPVVIDVLNGAVFVHASERKQAPRTIKFSPIVTMRITPRLDQALLRNSELGTSGMVATTQTSKPSGQRAGRF